MVTWIDVMNFGCLNPSLVVILSRIGAPNFGVIGLSDFVGRSASNELEPEQVVRQLTRAVLEHHQNKLADDATFVLVQWSRTH